MAVKDYKKIYRILIEKGFAEGFPNSVISGYINRAYELTKDDIFLEDMMYLLSLEHRYEELKMLGNFLGYSNQC